MIYNLTDLDETNLYHSVLKNILNELIVPVEQKFKTTGEFSFVESLNLKIFHASEKTFSDRTVSKFGSL